MNKFLYLITIMVIFVAYAVIEVNADDIETKLVGRITCDNNVSDQITGNNPIINNIDYVTDAKLNLSCSFNPDQSSDLEYSDLNWTTNTDDWSISLWVKHNSTYDTNQIIHVYNSTLNDEVLKVAGKNDGMIDTWNDYGLDQWNGPEYNNHIWNHYVIAFDGTKTFIYKNNTLIKTDLNPTQTPEWNVMFIGSWDGWTDFFNGTIDEICIWNKNITLGEISYLYNNSNGAPCANLTSDTLNITYIGPINNSIDKTNLTVEYNVTLKANCSINVNGVLNQTNHDVSPDTTLSFDVLMWVDGVYNYSINCTTEPTKTDSTGIYKYTFDSTGPYITYKFPLTDNTSIVPYDSDANINVSCYDINLYWSNFTIYYPNSTVYHNDEDNISITNTTNTKLYTIYNMTETGAWDVKYGCWDGHTGREFVVDNVTVIPAKAEIIYQNDNDVINLSIINTSMDGVITGLYTYHEFDRYTWNFTLDKDIKVDDHIIFKVTSNKNIVYLPNSQYQGHLVIGIDYWIDFVMSKMTVYPTLNFTRINETSIEMKVTFNEKIKKDKLKFKSFGGLNYAEQTSHFTVLTNTTNITLSCIECMNHSMGSDFDCDSTYADNSTLYMLQQEYCDGGESQMLYQTIAMLTMLMIGLYGSHKYIRKYNETVHAFVSTIVVGFTIIIGHTIGFTGLMLGIPITITIMYAMYTIFAALDNMESKA